MYIERVLIKLIIKKVYVKTVRRWSLFKVKNINLKNKSIHSNSSQSLQNYSVKFFKKIVYSFMSRFKKLVYQLKSDDFNEFLKLMIRQKSNSNNKKFT